MNVEFIKTIVRQDQTSYVDLLRVDGKLQTQLLVKAAEPNHYQVEKSVEGDQVDLLLNA